MENPRRKPGRPKASQRTLPLVLDVEQWLEEVEVAIPESTARTLAAYAAWVRQCRNMTVEEATTSTIDYALREVFRRDRLWRDRQGKSEGTRAQAAPAPTLAPPPPSIAPPASRPPTSTSLPSPVREPRLATSPPKET